MEEVPHSSSGDWKEFSNEDGITYYHNERTGSTQWEPPTGFDVAESAESGSDHSDEAVQGRHSPSLSAFSSSYLHRPTLSSTDTMTADQRISESCAALLAPRAYTSMEVRVLVGTPLWTLMAIVGLVPLHTKSAALNHLPQAVAVICIAWVSLTAVWVEKWKIFVVWRATTIIIYAALLYTAREGYLYRALDDLNALTQWTPYRARELSSQRKRTRRAARLAFWTVLGTATLLWIRLPAWWALQGCSLANYPVDESERTGWLHRTAGTTLYFYVYVVATIPYFLVPAWGWGFCYFTWTIYAMQLNLLSSLVNQALVAVLGEEAVSGSAGRKQEISRHWKSLRPVLDMLGAREAKARRLGAPIVTGYFAVVLVMSVVPVLSSLTRGTTAGESFAGPELVATIILCSQLMLMAYHIGRSATRYRHKYWHLTHQSEDVDVLRELSRVSSGVTSAQSATDAVSAVELTIIEPERSAVGSVPEISRSTGSNNSAGALGSPSNSSASSRHEAMPLLRLPSEESNHRSASNDLDEHHDDKLAPVTDAMRVVLTPRPAKSRHGATTSLQSRSKSAPRLPHTGKQRSTSTDSSSSSDSDTSQQQSTRITSSPTPSPLAVRRRVRRSGTKPVDGRQKQLDAVAKRRQQLGKDNGQRRVHWDHSPSLGSRSVSTDPNASLFTFTREKSASVGIEPSRTRSSKTISQSRRLSSHVVSHVASQGSKRLAAQGEKLRVLLSRAVDADKQHKLGVKTAWHHLLFSIAGGLVSAIVALLIVAPRMILFYPPCMKEDMLFFKTVLVADECSLRTAVIGSIVNVAYQVTWVYWFPWYTARLMSSSRLSTVHRRLLMLGSVVYVLASGTVLYTTQFTRQSRIHLTSSYVAFLWSLLVVCHGHRHSFGKMMLKSFFIVAFLAALVTLVIGPWFLHSSESGRLAISVFVMPVLSIFIKTTFNSLTSQLSEHQELTMPIIIWMYAVAGVQFTQRFLVFGLQQGGAQVFNTIFFVALEVASRSLAPILWFFKQWIFAKSKITFSEFERLTTTYREQEWRSMTILAGELLEMFAIVYAFFVEVMVRLVYGQPLDLVPLVGILMLQVVGEVVSDVISTYFETVYIERVDALKLLRADRLRTFLRSVVLVGSAVAVVCAAMSKFIALGRATHDQ